MPLKVNQNEKKTQRQRPKGSTSSTCTKGAGGSNKKREQPTEAESTPKVKSKGGQTARKPAKNAKSQAAVRVVMRRLSRESNPVVREHKSRIEVTSRSIDLEEDAEPPVIPTPETVSSLATAGNTRRDEPVTTKDDVTRADDEVKHTEKKVETKARSKKNWSGMDAAMRFWAKYSDIGKLRAEYAFLESIQCNKPTEAFDANTERNRDGAPKIYDENRVVLNRAGQEAVNYINASFISVKEFSHKLIIAQLPLMENESFVEDFWHMIYQEQITLVYLLVPDASLAKAPTQLFKTEHGEYQYVGKMFINNRRAETAGDPKEYTIEVLPEGNSDSIICQVHHHSKWQHLQQPPKPHRIIKMIHQFLSEKEIQSAGVCVVSVLGSGRACSFIGALIAINMLNKGIEPNICEIMTNIKQQRPGATESFAQYAGIFAIVFEYIARKRGTKTDPINKEMNGFIEDLAEVSAPYSPKP